MFNSEVMEKVFMKFSVFKVGGLLKLKLIMVKMGWERGAY